MKIYYNPKLKELAKQNRNNPTLGEKQFWQMVRSKQFFGFDFHRQKPIGEYIPDFYCHNLNLIVEIDGETHNDEEIIQKDLIKDLYFKERKIRILRIKDYEIFQNSKLVWEKLKKYLDMDYN